MRLPHQALRDRLKAPDVKELPLVIALSAVIGGLAGWLCWLAFA